MTGKLKSLILVESAGKARAVRKFVGSAYQVLSTEGFLKNLPKSRIAIDEENGYAPDYITVRGQGENLKMLRRATLKAGRIFLAMNCDATGEFLAWQCCELFGINANSNCRVAADELNKPAFKSALENARPIDKKLVNAFQAKQIIDKVVSHKLGEYLACKIYRGVKVGRFRAMLLKLISSKHRRGRASIGGNLTASTLQELAALELDFSTTKTRLLAEQLYEGGLITYPHGEIRLAKNAPAPETLQETLSDNLFNLYRLIYKAMEASSVSFALYGKCTDLALMAALDKLHVDWAEFYSVGINSLMKRRYIQQEDGVYKVTDLGKQVLDALAGFFDEDLSVEAYNEVTEQVNEVAEYGYKGLPVIKRYCARFNESFKAAMESLGENAVPKEEPVVMSGEICDKCGKPMIIKRGRYGVFLACSNYPECKNVKPYVEYLTQKCPKCGGMLTKRAFRGGRNLYGCENGDFQTWDDPVERVCNECGSTLFLHKFKERTPMLYCGNENCPTRVDHPINKILAEARRRFEANKQRRESKEK